MAEVLAGTSPGIPVGEMIAVMADNFGPKASNPRFSSGCIRNINRAILDVWLDFPRLRRFVVHDADITLRAGQAVYDVSDDVDLGGWGWTNCQEILSIRIPSASQTAQLELVPLQEFRRREDFTLLEGPALFAAVIDQKRVRIVPTPLEATTGKGDYAQATPYVSGADQRVSWPQGWDQVILLGAEYYGSRTFRPELRQSFKADYAEAREKLKTGELSGGPTVKYALVARTVTRRRFLPHDNSQDVRR